MTTGPAIEQGRAPQFVALAEPDLGNAARFIAAQSGRPRETVDAHLSWFLLENPARRYEAPLGFGLLSSDELVGCILCSPQFFRVRSEKILLMGSSLFYVDQGHRGYGGRLFLQYCRLGMKTPLFGTSANVDAAALWKAAGAMPIPYSDGELFGVIRWPPVLEEIAHRRRPSRLLSLVARSPAARIVGMLRPLRIDCNGSEALRLLDCAEQAVEIPLHDHPAKLTAERDLPYLRWRYFSGRDATVGVFAFRSRNPDKEILVMVNQRIRGFRSQINTLNVLDVYPAVPPDEWIRIVGALIALYEGTIDAVVLRNLDEDRQKVLCARGFHWRQFDAPIGWFLDKSRRLPLCEWYCMPADGDGLI